MLTQGRAGILTIDKPAGLTSRAAVDRVASLVRPEKVGHAGTLDPLATGVLVVCIGKATRLIDVIHQLPKAYRARFLLGRTSDTDDVTGHVVESAGPLPVGRADIEAVLPAFTGRILQAPPAYSAVHVAGTRAYKRARRGEAVEPAARPVEIHRLVLTDFASDAFEIEVDCGSGTYIRSIGRDIGRTLGCGAVLAALVRTRIGPFGLDSAVPLDKLDGRTIGEFLQPAAAAVQSLPQWTAPPDEIARIRAGRPFGDQAPINAADRATVAVLDGAGELLCLAEFDAGGRRLLPRRVFIE